MTKITINGQEVVVPDGMTIIQACESTGKEIPRFCYHERLEISGNCRMCLVEVEKSPKPVASCTQIVTEGMVIHTDSQMVKKAREGVMEFLLINHPLDCPICDQAGECDLQDQAFVYGNGKSRFQEQKRAVTEKNLGPLIKTVMNRCILCTRCVRFMEDIAGTPQLGAVNRGEDMQIVASLEQGLKSELSGNIIDLCPVGALTSKSYAFKARPWELQKTQSIDVLDALCSSIRVDSKNREVLRILPIRDDDVNQDWLSDKARFSYDALARQRLDMPMLKIDGILEEVSYQNAYKAIGERVMKASPSAVGAIAGDLTDVETMLVTKEMLAALGSDNYDCRQDGALSSNKERSMYIFNTPLNDIEEADLCLIIGSNVRHESPVLNSRLRSANTRYGMKVAVIGEKVDLTYDYKYLGNNPWILKQIASGDHPYSKELKNAKKPMIIVGSGVLCREDMSSILCCVKKICKNYNVIQEDWNGLNILQRAASRVGGLDIGFIPQDSLLNAKDIIHNSDVLFLMGADEVDIKKIKKSAFVIYVGHHGDIAANRADVILPGAAYTEKDGTYVNLEGRVRYTRKAVDAPHMAMEDWRIMLELSQYLGYSLSYSTLEQIRARMGQLSPVFAKPNITCREKVDLKDVKTKDFLDNPFANPIKNYYMTDVISRNSKTMMQCTQELAG